MRRGLGSRDPASPCWSCSRSCPKLPLDIPVLFDGPLDSPGTLQLLALCLLFAGIALTYDVLFGFTGLLSFGHALYFALGVYLADRDHALGLGPLADGRVHFAVGLVLPLVLGSVSLRVSGIAFAMVTLAFAQAGSVLVSRTRRLDGRRGGLRRRLHELPDAFVGDPQHEEPLLARARLRGAVFFVVRLAVSSSPGHVWRAIRENEPRVEVLGLRPFAFKLMAFVLASFLAVLGGVVYLLLISGATPVGDHRELHPRAARDGRARRRRDTLGRDDRRLPLHATSTSASARSRARARAGSPDVLRVPLSEPLFLLGALFILLVFFVPGGIASLPTRLRGIRPRREPLPEEAAV